VEKGHAQGILTAASLMVAAPQAADAVLRAKRLPSLGVGLHIVLVGGVPVLPPSDIPDLIGPDGRFTQDVVKKGAAIFLRPSVRRQMEREVQAQFEAFRQTGLKLDHVNGHHHFHMHPCVFETIVRLAPEYGAPAVRVPHEPFVPSLRARSDAVLSRFWNWAFHAQRTRRMKRLLAASGIGFNDAIFGLSDSGRMTEEKILSYLAQLPDGVSEIYCHPALARWPGPDNLPAHYMCEAEAAALTSSQAIQLVRDMGITLAPFAALPGRSR
jgi:hopanoid biosynthesis associated protein HpnK